MANLKFLNEDSPVARINKRLNEQDVISDKRSYLGMSVIGHKCHRYLQFVHYGCFTSVHNERIERLFNDGHSAEPQLVKALAKVGIHVTDQQQKVIGVTGHLQGHHDGRGSWFNDGYQLFSCDDFLIEFKTHNQKSFDELMREAKLIKTKPMHYSQMTAYMGFLGLEKGLYVAKNKNDSRIEVRVIDFDEDHFADLKRKEVEIVTADTLLPRIGNDNPTWFECKMCNAKDVCFGRKSVEHECRTCKHVDVLDGGKWQCGHPTAEAGMDILLSFDPCSCYEVGEMFDCTN